MELAIIDDDSLYCEIIKEHSEEIGKKITIFSNGNDFIKIGPDEAEKFDFIIIDHSLIDMTGVELVKSIRPWIPSKICLISTYGNALTSIQKKSLGVSGDFQKLDIDSIINWFHYFNGENDKTVPI